jgi:hypothetical protein
MIAPLRPPDTTAERASPRLHEARDFVAATLLRQPPAESGPRIAVWKAWAFVAWVAVVTAAFAVSMLHRL